ncbi:MAG TPA: TonB-dependent receptor plug domain-containing protein [Gemmatimonadaceae bacterium]|nr:TonB-dependent receptor plug domain-containing protein [Gemmatimonadaceae bacterium]
MSSLRTLLAAVALTACASGGAAAPTSGGMARDPNVITAAELANENSPSVYDAIQHLRPEMLRPRLANSSSSINSPGDYAVKVYLDGQQVGTISDLRSISTSTIKEIRYLSPAQAQQRFGSGVPGGAIVLTSR